MKEYYLPVTIELDGGTCVQDMSLMPPVTWRYRKFSGKVEGRLTVTSTGAKTGKILCLKLKDIDARISQVMLPDGTFVDARTDDLVPCI